MNKLKLVLISFALLLALWIASWFGLFRSLETGRESAIETPPTQTQSQDTRLIIDFGEGENITYLKGSLDGDETAFSLLNEALGQNNIEAETQQYDFGVFVKSINGFESSAEMAWIYFVNGEAGQVAADQTKVSPGDTVEWKYIPPSDE